MSSIEPLMSRIARVPEVEVPPPPGLDDALSESVNYLGSDAARRSTDIDVYWPKWNSPWWHLLACVELGEARRVPERAVTGLLQALKAFPVKVFWIVPDDLPAGCDAGTPALCHCQVASAYQMLSACGVDVDRELPWMAPWFVRHQMADGGLNCDSDAYLVRGECPSSMVATVPSLEAMLLGDGTLRDGAGERAAFVDRAAAFLIERRLMLGSPSVHNAVERQREPAWREPCFPRFYLYDVLRGLAALARWAEKRERAIPLAAIEPVVEHLLRSFPDGMVRIGRFAQEGLATRALDAAGAWTRQPASRFALLDVVSRVGSASPALTRQWADVRRRLLGLHEAGCIQA